MRIKRTVAHSACNKCDKCPTVFELDNGDFLVQGYKLEASIDDIQVPEGESLVRLPKDFVEKLRAALVK
jgi:hypothetical protein